MHILFVTTEIAGIYKIGGLADVSYSLPRALVSQGVDVTVVLPYYDDCVVKDAKNIGKVVVPFGQRHETVTVFEVTPSLYGFRLLLLKHPKLRAYGGSPIEHTFALYSQAVVSLYNAHERLFSSPIDVIHCHDWHTAAIPLLLKKQNYPPGALQKSSIKYPSSILTIHNLLYKGVVSDTIIDRLGAPRELFHVHDHSVSLLREGIEHAHRVTTVSPTYAKEITREGHHDVLGNSLIRRKRDVLGILNGIDGESWNPRTDPAIVTQYDHVTVGSVKPILKKNIQKEFGLSTNNSFLLGFVGRIEPRQKGIDLVMDAVKRFEIDKKLQMVILGTGEKNTVRQLGQLARAYPDRLSFIDAFDDTIARKIYAGCDAFLVPSRFEPCGLTQMIAMRYGTIPIVRKTGGLADSVDDARTGFVFDAYNGRALLAAIYRAYDVWSTHPSDWLAMMSYCMKADFSWDKSARRYREIYASLHPGV